MNINISKPVYLHFLDRELLNCFDLYDHLPVTLIYDTLRLLFLSTYEFAYLSTSLIFENRFAREIFNDFNDLFQYGHIELAIKENSLRDFVIVKSEQQYSHTKNLDTYIFYFDDTWKKIEGKGPIFKHKTQDTSSNIAHNILSDLQTGGINDSRSRLNITPKKMEIKNLCPYIIEKINLRENYAVTKLLFNDLYNKFNASLSTKQCFNIKISEHYVKEYISEYNGTLATGLNFGLDYFSYLCATFPFHHLPLWKQLYHRLGCLPMICHINSEDLITIRSSPEFQCFIDEFRRFILRTMNYLYNYQIIQDINNLTSINNNIPHIERIVREYITPPKKGPSNSDDFLKIIIKCTSKLKSIDINAEAYLFNTSKKWRSERMNENEMVFVVHGRNENARKALYEFLRAVGLKPLEWEQALCLTETGSPFIGDVIDKAFERSQAIIVLFTGDETAFLKKELLKPNEQPENLCPQPRPNVILEAGIALAKQPQRTIIVEIGDIRQISDLSGRHVVRLDNSVEKRNNLLSRLKTAGCAVNTDGSDWIKAGDFERRV